MLRFVMLALGSVLAVLFIIKSLKGKKYTAMVENLDSADYPLRFVYGVGFAWSETKLFALKGKIREMLMGQAKLLFEPKYAEYYANVSWAQTLAFVHLSLMLGFLAAGAFNSMFFAFIGIVVAGVFGFYFFNRMNDMLKTRNFECTAELPEIVSTLALLINAGMMLRNAWRMIADSKNGPVYDLMKKSCSDMDNGMSEVDAIHKFGRLSNSPEIRKFSSALSQSIERGGGELADFLGRQALEMLQLRKQLLLQKGEAAASKLLIPTALLFVGIIIAVITGAVGMLI